MSSSPTIRTSNSSSPRNLPAHCLAAEGLRVEIVGRRLFDALGFSLSPGDCIIVRARSGAGKTTLLRTLAGLRDPTEGLITHQGRDAASWGWPLWRRKIMLVTNDFPFGRETVGAAFERAFGLSVGPVEVTTNMLATGLNGVGLSHDVLVQPSASLSAGERQRARLVRALLISPPVLLLDEPTNALDEDAQSLVFARLADFRRAGGAILMATHAPPSQQAFAHQELRLGEHR